MSKIKFYKDSAKTQQVYPELDPEEMAQKANIDGYYEEMTVGAADNLTGRGDGVPASFLYRTAGGDEDIADGIATIQNIKGNTIVWNNNVPDNMTTASGTYYTLTYNSNTHEFLINYDTTSTSEIYYPYIMGLLDNSQGKYTNHKVYVRMDTIEATGDPISRRYINIEPSHSEIAPRSIKTLTTQAYGSLYFQIAPNSVGSIRFKLIIIDLTLMFGSGNEPTDMDDLDNLFPLDFYATNKGTLLNFTGESLNTIGFNQLNLMRTGLKPIWTGPDMVRTLDTSVYYLGVSRNGYVSDTQPTNINITTDEIRFRTGSANYGLGYAIRVFPNTKYCMSFSDKNNNSRIGIGYFDENGVNIYHFIPNFTNKVTTFTTSKNTFYILIVFYSDGQNDVYYKDPCVNLSWSGYRDGEYEEYWDYARELPVQTYFPNGMRKMIPQDYLSNLSVVYDEITPSQIIQRMDGGTFNSINSFKTLVGCTGNVTSDDYTSTTGLIRFHFYNCTKVTTKDNLGRYCILNTDFGKIFLGGRADYDFEGIGFNNLSGENTEINIFIFANKLNSYTGSYIDKFNSYLGSHPITIEFALKEPITTDLNIPLNLNYKVSDFGTEQILPENASNLMATSPFNGTILYGINAIDTLRRLPVNYISKNSMDNFLGELGTSTQSTWGATYNENTGEYDYETNLDLSQKANIDGYYEEMTVGAADNLTGKGDGVSAIFTRRTAGGDEDIADGVATIKSIKGNTLLWNQLIDHGNFDVNQNFHCESGAVIQTVSNNTLPVKITSVGGSNSPVLVCSKKAQTFKGCQGHKMLLRFDYKGSHDSNAVPSTLMYLIYNQSPWSSYQLMSPVKRDLPTLKTYWQRYGYIFTMKEYSDDPLFVNVYITTQLNKKSSQATASDIVVDDMWYFKNYMLIDLTAMFGAGNEPTTPEEFEELFPLDYYDYNTGSLLNFTGETLQTVGFNQWDEQWELGTFNTTTGVNLTSDTQIRSKNLMKVFPNTKYHTTILNLPQNNGAWMMFYDESMNIIQGSDYTPSTGNFKSANVFYCGNNNTFDIITPPNAAYMKFYMTAGYGNTYKNDICFNLSWSGYRDGEFEPYWEQTKDLPISTYFPAGMKKIIRPSRFFNSSSANSNNIVLAYDELTNNMAIQRIGYGTLNSVASFKTVFGSNNNLGYNSTSSTTGLARFAINNCQKVYPSYSTIGYRVINNDFAGTFEGAGSSLPYEGIGLNNNSASSADVNLFILESRLTSYPGDTMINKLNAYLAEHPINVEFEMAQPIITEFEESLNLNYKVSDFGTEEILPTNTSTPTTSPFNGNIAYGINAADTIRRLPENYMSEDSMEAFLSVLNVVTNGTWAMTYNTGTGKYSFTFTPSGEEEQL